MGKFHDYLATLDTMGDTVALPEGFSDGITAAYDEDFSIPAAKVGVMQSELDAANETIAILKAQNYDLLMAVPAANPDNSNPDADPNDPVGTEDGGIDSLFGDEKKDED